MEHRLQRFLFNHFRVLYCRLWKWLWSVGVRSIDRDTDRVLRFYHVNCTIVTLTVLHNWIKRIKVLQNGFYINCSDADNVEFLIRKVLLWQLKSIELFKSHILFSFSIFKSVKRTVTFVNFCHTKQHFGRHTGREM